MKFIKFGRFENFFKNNISMFGLAPFLAPLKGFKVVARPPTHNPLSRQCPLSQQLLTESALVDFPTLYAESIEQCKNLTVQPQWRWARIGFVHRVQHPLKDVTKSTCQKCFEDWKKRWHKCIISEGDYFEGDNIEIYE